MGLKILFLDVDGVLNSRQFLETWTTGQQLCPILIGRLNQVVRRTGCKLVVSSAWRLGYGIAQLTDILQEAGLEADLYDYTPDGKYEVVRAEEIGWWLTGKSDLEAFAVVDDEDIGEYINVARFFVQTDVRVGLTDQDVQKLIALLGKEN